MGIGSSLNSRVSRISDCGIHSAANSGTCSSSYFSIRMPTTSMNEARGCDSSSPTPSIRVSSKPTSCRYSVSVCGTNPGSRGFADVEVLHLLFLALPHGLIAARVKRDRRRSESLLPKDCRARRFATSRSSYARPFARIDCPSSSESRCKPRSRDRR